MNKLGHSAVPERPTIAEIISRAERSLSMIRVGNDKNPSPHSAGYTKGFADCLDALKRALSVGASAIQQEPTKPQQPPHAWETLAMFLAERAGDDPYTFIWEGNPPEPRGGVWYRYKCEAKAILGFLAGGPTP